jgi:hypothetical protein
MVKKFLAIILSALSAITAFAFEGNYAISGNDPYDKMDYTGSLSIKKDKNNVYQAKWVVQEGGKQYKYNGTGLSLDDKTISFTYKDSQSGSEEGLQIYTRKDDQTLSGPFVILDKNLVGSETITLR